MNRKELLKSLEELKGSFIKDCVGCIDCAGCAGCIDCADCTDCINCINCINCTDCTDCMDFLLCVGLTGQSNGYWLLNKEVTKEEFEAAKQELLKKTGKS